MKKLTPLQAIRKRCLDCGDTALGVRNCIFDGKKEDLCPLYSYRMGRQCGKPSVKLIRKYCLECCNGSSNEVKECGIEKCPLHFYRFGKIPGRKANPETIRKMNLARKL